MSDLLSALFRGQRREILARGDSNDLGGGTTSTTVSRSRKVESRKERIEAFLEAQKGVLFNEEDADEVAEKMLDGKPVDSRHLIASSPMVSSLRLRKFESLGPPVSPTGGESSMSLALAATTQEEQDRSVATSQVAPPTLLEEPGNTARYSSRADAKGAPPTTDLKKKRLSTTAPSTRTSSVAVAAPANALEAAVVAATSSRRLSTAVVTEPNSHLESIWSLSRRVSQVVLSSTFAQGRTKGQAPSSSSAAASAASISAGSAARHERDSEASASRSSAQSRRTSVLRRNSVLHVTSSPRRRGASRCSGNATTDGSNSFGVGTSTTINDGSESDRAVTTTPRGSHGLQAAGTAVGARPRNSILKPSVDSFAQGPQTLLTFGQKHDEADPVTGLGSNRIPAPPAKKQMRASFAAVVSETAHLPAAATADGKESTKGRTPTSQQRQSLMPGGTTTSARFDRAKRSTIAAAPDRATLMMHAQAQGNDAAMLQLGLASFRESLTEETAEEVMSDDEAGPGPAGARGGVFPNKNKLSPAGAGTTGAANSRNPSTASAIHQQQSGVRLSILLDGVLKSKNEKSTRKSVAILPGHAENHDGDSGSSTKKLLNRLDTNALTANMNHRRAMPRLSIFAEFKADNSSFLFGGHSNHLSRKKSGIGGIGDLSRGIVPGGVAGGLPTPSGGGAPGASKMKHFARSMSVILKDEEDARQQKVKAECSKAALSQMKRWLLSSMNRTFAQDIWQGCQLLNPLDKTLIIQERSQKIRKVTEKRVAPLRSSLKKDSVHLGGGVSVGGSPPGNVGGAVGAGTAGTTPTAASGGSGSGLLSGGGPGALWVGGTVGGAGPPTLSGGSVGLLS